MSFVSDIAYFSGPRVLCREERREAVARSRKSRPGGVPAAEAIDVLDGSYAGKGESCRSVYDWFDRVVVINLDRRPDRWERIQRHLADIGWPFRYPERVSAVDGRLDKRPGWWRAGAPAWGCYRSHLGAVEKALDDDVKSLLVLEDDVLMGLDFRKKVAEFLRHVPEDWHGLYLGGQHIRPAKQPPIAVGNGIVRATNVNRLHAYALRGDYLQAARDHLADLGTHAQQHRRAGPQGREKAHHVDHRMGVLHETGRWNIYCPERWVAGQADGRSDICAKKLGARFWQRNPRPRKDGARGRKKLLITAHPRSGTKYLSRLCQAFGLDVGHETMRRDGICSWMLAVEADFAPYGGGTKLRDYTYEHVVRLVRHPMHVLASSIYTENIEPDQPILLGKDTCREFSRRHRFSERSWAFRRYFVRPEGNRYEHAVQTLLAWDAFISKRNPAFTVHVESAQEELPKALGLERQAASRLPTRKVNARKHPLLTWSDLKPRLRTELVEGLERYAQLYGYDLDAPPSLVVEERARGKQASWRGAEIRGSQELALKGAAI